MFLLVILTEKSYDWKNNLFKIETQWCHFYILHLSIEKSCFTLWLLLAKNGDMRQCDIMSDWREGKQERKKLIVLAKWFVFSYSYFGNASYLYFNFFLLIYFSVYHFFLSTSSTHLLPLYPYKKRKQKK